MGLFTRPVERDDENRFRAAPYSAIRPITAAAATINISDKTELQSLAKRRAVMQWQTTAWSYYDLVGEVKYSANLIGAVMSRIRLYAAYVTDEDTAPSHIKDMIDLDPDLVNAAVSTMRRLGKGNGGVPGMLQDAAINLFITGECWLVQEPGRIGMNEGDRWSIRSVDEIVFKGGRSAGIFIKPRRDATANEMRELSKKAAVARIWRMHPRFSEEADCSMLGLLELLDELLLLNKTARGTAKSRLNAGILLMPDDMANIAQSDGDADPDDPTQMAEYSDDDSDTIEEEIQKALITPIADEGSASSVMPVILRGPMEALDKIRHITFERSFDPALVERADKVLDRILAGLDIPKEIVQGIGNAKYANGVQIEENLFKAHIEPLALLICDSLTDAFLHPILRAMGWTEDEIERVVIWYDPSSITSKPSKAEAAMLGYQNKIISAEAWRRAHGFSASDAPTELEMAQRIAVERGLLNEPLTNALFKTLMPDLLKDVQQQQLANSPDGEVVLDALPGQAPEEPAAPQTPAAPSTAPGEEVSPANLIEP